ncbi:lipase family protein [Rhodococcus maanshanensis]|uniref:Secretory lipase n=1 Tax=Rhodococcus maanshanensis TaxID=183556 RepID=A0A1H7RW67_9NOCA|nr:lipase family protein [Rhodococcus maanshanensis]SEL64269.1 Secretory lipase [Rhodococcus maanshanensis]
MKFVFGRAQGHRLGLRAGATVLALLVLAVPAAGQAAADPVREPGTVVADKALPVAAEIGGAATGSRQLTYWTEGPTGAPALSTGAVYLPKGTAPAGGWPVVSWAHGTNGVGDDCAPSHGFDVTSLTRDYVSAWLTQGYAVVASDFVGLGTEGVHAYLHGRSEGRAVIDMVRAARKVTPELSPRWVAVGHSQGGHAAMFAAHEATRYAPELDYRGAVATGTPANLELLFPLGGPGFPNLGLNGLTAFAGYVIAGLQVARPDLPIDEYLTPRGRELVETAKSMCFLPLHKYAAPIGVGELFSRPLGDERIRSALRDYLAVPTTGYDRPVFIGQGLRDQTVPFPLSTKLAADMQLAGQPVTYRSYDAFHGSSVFEALPDTTAFVRSLFGTA